MPNPTAPAEHLLLVDDDPTILALLNLLLSAEGHHVTEAATGEAALIALTHPSAAATPPTAVLVDMQLPGLRGAALAARLREHLAPSTLLLGMSGSEPAPADRAAFDAFIHKPFDPAELLSLIRGTRAQTAAAPLERTPTPSHPALDEAIFARLAASMPPAKLRELYNLCFTDAATRLSRMRAAAGKCDPVTFTHEAHALKGSCSMLGASHLHSLAAQMETGALACTSLLNDFATAADNLQRMLDARIDLNS